MLVPTRGKAGMLRRKMTEALLDWKKAQPSKVFILLGARQTGKTYTVRQFAREHYGVYLEVNFLEDQENGAFLANASSADELGVQAFAHRWPRARRGYPRVSR